jgi:HlyD family secretion protein
LGGSESPGGSGFIVIGSLSDSQVSASFSEADVATLAVGQTAVISLSDRTTTYTGKVSSISPVGTVSSRLVKYTVMIAFDSVPTDILFGQGANVTVTTKSVSDVVYVSSSAVTDIQNNSGTVTVRVDGKDEQRTVQIGLRGDQYTEIKSGLSVGDEVVL